MDALSGGKKRDGMAAGACSQASSSNDISRIILNGKRMLSSWAFVRGIGIGQFGSVVIVHPKAKQQPKAFAMKCIGKYPVIAQKAVQRTMQELFILSKISHPFILTLHAAFQDENSLYLITELCEGGTLDAILAKTHKLDYDAVVILMAQLLSALECLHSKGIVHMDIKPENCLLDQEGNLRLSDFNASRIWDAKGRCESSENFMIIGTPGYIAPEVLAGKWLSRGSPDYWAMGVCTFQLLHGRNKWPFPFKTHEGELLSGKEMLESMQKLGSPNFDKNLPSEAVDLIARLLKVDSKQRLGCGTTGIQDIKKHGFFKGMDWEALKSRKVTPKFKPPSDALLNAAADKMTMTKWAFEQLAMTQEKKAPLSNAEQLLFGEWDFSVMKVQDASEHTQAQLDEFISMPTNEIKEFINKSSDETIELFVSQIRALKLQWLDENCKLSLAEFVNHNLRVENAQLEEQITGLTKELQTARLAIIKLKKSLMETSLNPLGPRKKALT